MRRLEAKTRRTEKKYRTKISDRTKRISFISALSCAQLAVEVDIEVMGDNMSAKNETRTDDVPPNANTCWSLGIKTSLGCDFGSGNRGMPYHETLARLCIYVSQIIRQ